MKWDLYKQTFITIVVMVILVGCVTTKAPTVFSYSSEPIAPSTYEMPPPGNDVIGKTFVIQAEKGDTIDKIAQRYDVGGLELMAANPRIKPYRLYVGEKVVVPREYILPPPHYRKGIVINTAELRLYYFTPEGTVMTFPVALGKEGWRTPLGSTYVYRKEEQPTWYVPKAIRDSYLAKKGEEHPKKILPGPKNPLGDYAIYLHMRGYLIHGTNNPASIGRLVSSGCIRMQNADVAELYQYVKRGTPVNLIYYPDKTGWRDGKLYLESHKKVKGQEGLYETNYISVDKTMQNAIENRHAQLNQKDFEKVLRAHTGVPTIIGYQQNG